MRIEAHKRNLKESLEEIDEAIKLGLQSRQRSLGFHTSAASADMIELLLHKNKLVDLGFMLNARVQNPALQCVQQISEPPSKRGSQNPTLQCWDRAERRFGVILKHEWLKSEKTIKSKLGFQFPQKEEILKFARQIELERNKLCYGPVQPETLLVKVLNDFNALKELLKEILDETQ